MLVINLSNNLFFNYFKECGGGGRTSKAEEQEKEKQSHNKCFGIVNVNLEFRNDLLPQLYCLKIFWYAGNEEAYQAPTSTRPLGLTRSVPDFSGYQA